MVARVGFGHTDFRLLAQETSSFFMWISFLIIFIAFSLIQTFKACTSIGKAFFFSSIQLLVSVIIISAVWLTSFVIIMNYPYAFF